MKLLNSPDRSFRGTIIGWIWRLWPLILPLIFYSPTLLGYPYPTAEAEFSDVTITHLPNYLFLKESIISEQTIPLWSNLIFSGTPFGANPLSGLWYPPGWLPLFFPPHVGFGLTTMLHILIGGIGLYLLMRSEGLSHRASLFSALAFQSLPKLIAHLGAGHLTLLYAVPWIPWISYLSQPPPTGQMNKRYLVGPGVVLGLVFLADPRWAFYAGIFWVAWAISHRFEGEICVFIRNRRSVILSSWRWTVLWAIGQLALAVFLAAALLIPLLEFTGLSSRDALTPADNLAFSLPPIRLVLMLIPNYGGNHELILYGGAVVFILGILAMLWPGTRRKGLFWVVALVISLIFSLGEILPFAEQLAAFPLINLLRVPSRALFLFGLSFCALAGYGIDNLVQRPESREVRTAKLALSGLIFLASILFLLVNLIGIRSLMNFFYGALFIGSGSIWIWIRINRRISERIWFIGLVVIAFLDWGLMNRSLLSIRPPGRVFEEHQEVADFVDSVTAGDRFYTPSYSVPQQTSAVKHIGRVDGVDPLYLERYSRFMDGATGVPRTGYSVSIPPFSNGDPHNDNDGFEPDATLLGLLNVKVLVADFEILTKGFSFLERIGDSWVYENEFLQPKAWVSQTDDPLDRASTPVNIVEETIHVRHIEASGPGRLVYSEINYPGWNVWVDGEAKAIATFKDLLLGVELLPGFHEVEFRFQPWSVYIGLVLSLGTIGLLVLWWRTDMIRFTGNCNVSERGT